MSTSHKIVGIAGRKGSGKSTAAQALVAAGFVEVPFAAPLKQRCRAIFDLSAEATYGPSDAREAPIPEAARGGLPVNAWWTAAWERWQASGFWRDLFVVITSDGVVSTLKPAADILAGFERSTGRATDLADPDVQAALLRFHARGVFARLWARGTAINARHILQQIGTEYGRALYEDVWVDAWAASVAEVLAGFPYSAATGVLPHKPRAVPATPPRGVVVSDMRFPGEAQAILARNGVPLWIDAGERLGPQTDFHASEPPREVFIAAGVELATVNANGSRTETLRSLQDVLRARGVEL